MRYYIYISLIAFLSVFCFDNAMGQGVTVVGNNNVNGKTLIKSDFALSKLSNTDSGIVYIGADSIARILPLSYVKGSGGGGGGSVDSVTISNDSLFYWTAGTDIFVGMVAGATIDSSRYVLYEDTARNKSIATYTYVDSLFNEVPTANDFQTVLDNGNTSNKDFIVERSSYTGYTRIGDGISSFAPPNPSRVSFYVTSKTQGQGAGSGIGYGIQSVAEYIDSVGFPSSTTLIGVKGQAMASASTSSGGLYDHNFTTNSAGANMAGLIGEAWTRDSATTTSAAAIVAMCDAFEQSHIRFGVSLLSIGTKRRTGTTIDSFAAIYIQQRGSILGSGTLGSNYGMFIDSMVGGNTNYGIWFKNNPSHGSVATANYQDFSIKTGTGAATKIHGPVYGYDTAHLTGEVYTPNLPIGTQDSIVYIGADGRHYQGVAPDTIEAGDGIIATKAGRTVTLKADTTYLETMFFKNYGNSFGDDFKMGNMTWNQFIYGDGNGDFIFNNGSGPGWMFHFVQNNLDTPLTINTQNEVLIGSVANSAVDAGSYKLQVQGNVYIRDSIFIANPLKAAIKDTVLSWQSGKVYAIPFSKVDSVKKSNDSFFYYKGAVRTFIGLDNSGSGSGIDSVRISGDTLYQCSSGTCTFVGLVNSGGGGSGTVTSFTFTDGNGFDGTVTNSTTTPTLSIDLQADHNFVSDAELTNFTAAYNDKINSAAYSAGQLTLTQQDAGTVTATINDATTSVKGISSFNASDFDVSSGAVSTDYTNGQAASGSTKGFLTSSDWTTFNNKQAALGFTAVPDTRTINGNALSSNVTLDAGDIDPVTNRNYVTDAQAVVIGNTSGTNTGDQTTITGNAGTATALQTGRTIDNTTFDGTANIKLNRVWQGKLAGELDTLTTGVKLTFRMPYACTVTGVKAAVNTASSSGNITIDIHENGTTIMSTDKITIDATETTSLDATTQPTVTDTSIAADALIQVEVDAAGTNAISGEVTIYYTLQ